MKEAPGGGLSREALHPILLSMQQMQACNQYGTCNTLPCIISNNENLRLMWHAVHSNNKAVSGSLALHSASRDQAIHNMIVF